MEGWVKTYRKILENPIICKDAETYAIWSYLLLNATHKEIPAMFKGKKIMLQPGQLITGIKTIGDKFKINKDKVQRTLKCFETDKQINQETSSRNRLISIVNWELYQSNDKQIDKQMINKCETSDKPVITNKNERNKEIYYYFINKYKSNEKDFFKQNKIINQMRNDEKWNDLTWEQQLDLQTAIFFNEVI